MRKILMFIVVALILFAGCASKPNTGTNGNPDNTNSSDTLYQQIEKEAICPCSTFSILKNVSNTSQIAPTHLFWIPL